MPTILSHPVVPLALAIGLGSHIIPTRLAVLGVLACILPDADVLAFRLGIAYSNDFGHRGFTHSLFFALLVGLSAMPFAKTLQSTRKTVFVFIALCTASHGMLDMLTNGGLGVAFFWPFSSERHFLPFQVVQVSPLSLSKIMGPAGLLLFKSELTWLWLPATAMAFFTLVVRKTVLQQKLA
jgi:inner membrane protein